MATYGQLMQALSAVYGFDSDSARGQMRGRVQNFQKLEIPIGLGSKTGRGKKIDYARNEIYQLCFALELSEIGLSPSHVAKILSQLWEEEIAGIFKKEWVSPSSDDAILIVETSLLSGQWNKDYQAALAADPNTAQGTSITPTSLKRIGEDFKGRRLGRWRHCSLLNVTQVVSDVERELTGILPPEVAYLTEPAPSA